MDKNRLWVVGSVLVMAAILALGFVLGIQPQLAAASAANLDRATVEATNAEQSAVLAQLKEDFAGLEAVRAELAPLALSVPSGTEMPAFVTQLSELAAQSEVTLTAITVADALAYAPVVAPVVADPAAEVPAEGEDTASEPVPAEAAAAPIATAGVPPVTDPRITASSFASLAVQITIKGDYNRVLVFVNGLQTGTRLVLVSGLSTVEADPSAGAPPADPDAAAPAAVAGLVDATISGLVYVLIPEAAADGVQAAG